MKLVKGIVEGMRQKSGGLGVSEGVRKPVMEGCGIIVGLRELVRNP